MSNKDRKNDRKLQWNNYLHELIYDKIYHDDYNVLKEVEDAMYEVWGEKIPCDACQQLEYYEIVENDDKISGDFDIEKGTFKCICTKCGNEFLAGTTSMVDVVIALNEQNKSYENETGSIGIKAIRELPFKYDIDVKSLSIVLELPEHFEKYYAFGLPNKKHSDFLKRIYTTPALFLEYLEKNADKIPKKVYLQSLKATTYLVINGDEETSEIDKGKSNNLTKKRNQP